MGASWGSPESGERRGRGGVVGLPRRTLGFRGSREIWGLGDDDDAARGGLASPLACFSCSSSEEGWGPRINMLLRQGASLYFLSSDP